MNIPTTTVNIALHNALQYILSIFLFLTIIVIRKTHTIRDENSTKKIHLPVRPLHFRNREKEKKEKFQNTLTEKRREREREKRPEIGNTVFLLPYSIRNLICLNRSH